MMYQISAAYEVEELQEDWESWGKNKKLSKCLYGQGRGFPKKPHFILINHKISFSPMHLANIGQFWA